ncbi:MAG: DUF45 domain-containing protein [Coriobacteriia bacterium]|nr:DUF45 domain-containing protein [Coriobacteriia bacterium]
MGEEQTTANQEPPAGHQAELIEFHGEFSDIKVLVRREPGPDMYLALVPPTALPYVVAPIETPINDVAFFIQQRLEILRELREDMLKHFKKTSSLKCRFETGDVAHLLGRPLMIRVSAVSKGKAVKKAVRVRANVKANLHPDVSLLSLEVMQAGNYEQRRAAFFSFAGQVFSQNIYHLMEQCMQRVFPEAPLPSKVNSRPMRDNWVLIDESRSVVWFSENLIPFPPNAVVYAYLVEAIKLYAPNATEEERLALLATGVPNWQDMKALLGDPNCPYALTS